VEGRPRPVPGVKAYPLGVELLLYAPDARAAHALNQSARAIWELCDGERAADDIVRQLAESLGVPARDLEADVLIALAELASHGLLEVA
jgi:hypothetical protein